MLQYPKICEYDLLLRSLQAPGLGNSLFPLHRAFDACANDPEQEIIFPEYRYWQPRRLLRRDHDKRNYTSDIRRRTWREIRLLATHRFLRKSNLKVHYGLENYFHSLNHVNKQVFKEYLLDQLSLDLIPSKQQDPETVALHLRLGDYSSYSTDHKAVNQRQNPQFLKKIIADQKITKIKLFSDQRLIPDEYQFIVPYLIDDAYKNEPKSPFFDLFQMGTYERCIASGSTFSMWAAYFSDNIFFFDSNFNVEQYTSPTHIPNIIQI